MTIPRPATGLPPASTSPDPQATASSAGGWQTTRAQTRLAHDEEEYLANDSGIGRPVGQHRRELFVSCDAAPAMQQQFERLHLPFIAIHDVATQSSRKLLAAIAAASKGAVQQLVIRRQGYGNALATLEFVDLPTAEGGGLRIYSTDAEADRTARHALACTLLGFSTLGAILMGDMPGHAPSGVFAPLREEMISGSWPNRHLLLLPLTTGNALVTQGMELAHGTGVDVRATPAVARPADAWNFISSTWERLREELSPASRARAPSPAQGGANDHAGPYTSAALPLRPMPAVHAHDPRDAAASDPLARYVRQLSELTGMASCCVFEVATGQAIAHAGASPGAEHLAEHGAELLAAMLDTSRTLGLGHALPDAAITLGSHHLVLRAVPKHPGLALHAVLDKAANLTLARLQIMRMDALFDEGA